MQIPREPARGLPLPGGRFFLSNPAIKRRAILIAALLFAHGAASAGEFTRTLTPEKLSAAGLGKLTPRELAELEVLIEAYKNGAAPNVPVTAQSPGTPDAAKATPAAYPEPKSGKLLPDWVGALITLKRAETSTTKPQAMESRIAGDFVGWKGRTNFKLENGQVWTQANDDSYVYTPPLKSPKVRIFPATFGTFWLEIEGVGQRCRVRPLRLE